MGELVDRGCRFNHFLDPGPDNLLQPAPDGTIPFCSPTGSEHSCQFVSIRGSISGSSSGGNPAVELIEVLFEDEFIDGFQVFCGKFEVVAGLEVLD